jgi:hypothetical protein
LITTSSKPMFLFPAESHEVDSAPKRWRHRLG